jgi:sugar fermentation stimulation protein A
VKLQNETVTAHCPNTGSMKGLLDEGNEVYLLPNNDPKRKLKFGLEIIKSRKNLVGVNTHMANRIAQHGLENNLINELKNNDVIKPEVFYNKETRFDFLLEKKSQKSFVEVKNVTLFRDKNTAEFPDAITSRGSKHLLTLIDAIKKGYKTYLLFLVQIQNMKYFKIAKDIDEQYYKNYLLAKKAGVNFLAYRCNISSKKIFIDQKLKIIDE